MVGLLQPANEIRIIRQIKVSI